MRDADEERMADALKPRSGSDERLDFLVRSALKEASEKPPKEWSQERQDFLVQSALKEAAAKRRMADCQPPQ